MSSSKDEDTSFLPCNENLLTAIGATMGATVADAVRTLRPGGPLDEMHLDIECPHCSSRTDESLRWFYTYGLLCRSCGGEFNRSQVWAPLLAMMVLGSNTSLLEAVKAGDLEFNELVKTAQAFLALKGADES